MSAWWDQAMSGVIGGVGGGGLGTAAGIFGAAAGVLAPKGVARLPMLTIHALFVVLGIACLIAAGVALYLGQPYHVWYVLLLPGAVLTMVMGPLFPVVRMRYQQADQRRIEAEEIRRS